MRIAVIGGTGLLGQHTVRTAVRNGYETVVIHRSGSRLERIKDLDCRTLEADLNDCDALTEALRTVDGVINCAGYYPGEPLPIEEEVHKASSQMKSFCRAAQESGCNKIVYVGAASTLKKSPTGDPGDETLINETRPKNNNPFVQVKWAMEQIALDYVKKGLPLVIGVPSMAFGEYDYGPTAGRLIVGIANRSIPGYIYGRRNVLYAGDVGRGLIRCFEKGQSGQRYLLVGENMTTDKLVALIAQKADVRVPKRVPRIVAQAVAGYQKMRHQFGGPVPTITSTAIKVLAGGQFLDGTKALNEFDFRSFVSVEEAIERAITWFKENGYLAKEEGL